MPRGSRPGAEPVRAAAPPISSYGENSLTQNRERLKTQALIESGAHLFSAFSSLRTGNLNARAAALDADWAQTRALYDEALLTDSLLDGMAAVEVQFARGGAGGTSALIPGQQYALQRLDAVAKAQKIRRGIQLRARIEANRSLFAGANQRVAGGLQAAGYGLKAGAAVRRLQQRLDVSDTSGL